MKHITRVIPGHLVNGTIGWTSACAGSGVALLSLMTGSMASRWGIIIIQPLCVSFFFLDYCAFLYLVYDIFLSFLFFLGLWR